ncbi:CsbD family protein [Sphingomonas prati]|uniref:Uncharacterized protein YjbJ (UPF0337 family) n=1 Tax=Sphingomonas prati TaxID=1843237 RepID=A0A7W9F256_9SPHN|nr:CsbD family protein [Sphingomonas prati]MBB5730172.1 uncharacterized protein YjbJ (UPF0337 family) [Sphingomonas prati]GGE92084.1 hypothetical protein GCM10011404_26230 [Sphingomonas prati]
MTRAKDTPPATPADKEEGRAREAKGSVKEAIGKIIGDAVVEEHGNRERKAGARQAASKHPTEPDDAG